MSKTSYRDLFFFSFIVISIKWVTSYYFFDESIDVKIIFESVDDGKLYYPLIKFLAELEFNRSYDPEIKDLKIIPLPFAGILLHSFLLKILGFFSFLLADLICVFIFLYIFYNIFRFVISENLSLLSSIILFLLPIFLSNTYLYNISYIQNFADSFYNLRVPRPMLSNLFFFGFLLIILKLNFNFKYNYKIYSALGLILGLTLSSFFYYFFTQICILSFFFLIKFKRNILKELYKNYKYFLVLILTFLITTTPFLLNLLFHENEFTARQCVYTLDYHKKAELLKYLIGKYLSIKFIFLFVIISLINFWVNHLNLEQRKITNIFYISFIGSFIGPIVFILLSNKSCVFYHFVNFIILNGFLYIIISIILIIGKFSRIKLNFLTKFFSILFLTIIFGYQNWADVKKKYEISTYKDYREEFSNVTNFIKKNYSLDKINLLTFETDLIIWSIMNDVKHLMVIDALFTSKKDNMIENDIFSAFKLLNLDEDNFKLFIKNKKSSWRYINQHISKYVYYKYQANSLVTFKDSTDFTKEEIDHINNTHLLLHQQSIIPRFELYRLEEKFKIFNKNIIYPDLIILNKKDDFFIYDKLKIEKFCKIIDGEFFVLYFLDRNKKCKKN